jgi:hypothetical protein
MLFITGFINYLPFGFAKAFFLLALVFWPMLFLLA